MPTITAGTMTPPVRNRAPWPSAQRAASLVTSGVSELRFTRVRPARAPVADASTSYMAW